MDMLTDGVCVYRQAHICCITRNMVLLASRVKPNEAMIGDRQGRVLFSKSLITSVPQLQRTGTSWGIFDSRTVSMAPSPGAITEVWFVSPHVGIEGDRPDQMLGLRWGMGGRCPYPPVVVKCSRGPESCVSSARWELQLPMD